MTQHFCNPTPMYAFVRKIYIFLNYYLSKSIIDNMSTAANVTISFSRNRKKKSITSATTLFQIGGMVNSCHVGVSWLTVILFTCDVWLGGFTEKKIRILFYNFVKGNSFYNRLTKISTFNKFDNFNFFDNVINRYSA